MPSFLDLTGKVFGKLTALSRAPNQGKRVMWNCVCECGNTCVPRGHALTSGHTVSCGCVGLERLAEHNFKHGGFGTRAYSIWRGMKDRCFNPARDGYADYGGRGITVCERWLDFRNFLADMGPPPDGKSIDRIDNNDAYRPGNCRWATPSEQLNNRRNNINVTFRGKTQTITEWADELDINIATLYARIVVYKWELNDAMTRPVQPHVVTLPCSTCGGKHSAKGLCKRCYSRERLKRKRTSLKAGA